MPEKEYKEYLREAASNLSPKKSYDSIGRSDILPKYTEFNTDEYKDYVDLDIYNPALVNIDDIRASNQSTTEKLGRSLAQAGWIAGSTFVDTFLGTAAGLASLATGGEDGEFEFSDFINNPVSKTLDEFITNKEKDNQLFMTSDEASKEWYERLGSANFWGDTIIKNAGFAIGALAAGTISGAALSRLAGLKDLQAESKILNDIVKLQKAGKADEVTKLIQESKLAGLSDDAIKQEIIQSAKKLGRVQGMTEFGASFLGSIGEARMEALQNGNDFKEAQLQELIQKYGAEDSIPESEIQQLNDRTDSFQNTVFALNLPLLTLSNFVQFKNTFLNGVKPTREILRGNIKDVSGKLVYQRSKFDMAKKLSKNTFMEMTEEQMQYAIGQASKDYYDRVNDGNSKFDILQILTSSFKGMKDAYGTAEGWENAVAGGIFGLLGVPTVRSLKNDKGKFQLPIQLAGGARSDYREFKNNEKATKALVNKANNYGFDSDFRKLYNSLVVNQSIEKDKINALENDNEVGFRTLDKQQLVNMVSTFSDLGMLDKYLTNIEEEGNLTADEIRNKYKQTITDNEGNKKDIDPFEKITDEDLVNRFKQKSQEVKNETKSILELKENIEKRFPNASEQNINSLLTLAYSTKDIDNRINQLSNKIKSSTYDVTNLVGENSLLDEQNLLGDIDTNIYNEDKATEFLSKVKNVVDKNPDKIDLLSDAVDLVTLKKLKRQFNEKYAKMFDPTYQVERDEQANNKALDILEKQKLNNEYDEEDISFYNNNVLDDSEGFQSAEIELEDSVGNKNKVAFRKSNPSTLFDTEGNAAFSTKFIRNESKYDNEGRYFDTPNGKVRVKIKSPYEVRTRKYNEKAINEYRAKYKALEILYNQTKKKLSIKQDNVQKKLDELYKNLDELYSTKDSITDGRIIRSKAYKELINNIQEIEQEINNLEKEISDIRNTKQVLYDRKETIKKDILKTQQEIKDSTEKVDSPVRKEYQERLDNLVELEKDETNIISNIDKLIEEKEQEIRDLSSVVSTIKKYLYNLIKDFINKNKNLVSTSFINEDILSKLRGNNKLSNLEYDKVSDFLQSEYLLRLEEKDYIDRLTVAQSELEQLKQKREQLLESYEENKKILTDELNKLVGEMNVFEKELNKLETKKIREENKLPVTTQSFIEKETSLELAPVNYKQIDLSLNGMAITAGNDSDGTTWITDPKEAINSVNPNIEERRFYRWLENEGYKQEGNRLMTVTINDPIYGIGKEKSIYTEPKIEGVTHNLDDIRFIVVDSKGNPIEYKGNIVSGRLRTSNPNWSNNEPRYYTSDTSKTLDDKIKEEAKIHNEFRESIKANSEQNRYLDILFVNRGTTVKSEEPDSVIGTLVSNKEQLDELQIEVSTGSIVKGIFNVNYPTGRVVIRQNNTIIPAITRKLNGKEAVTVLELIKAYYEKYQKSEGTRDEKRANANKIENFAWKLSSVIKNYIYVGATSNKPVEMLDDNLIIDDATYSIEDLLSGRYDEQILDKLKEKVFQVNKEHLNKNKPFHTIEFNNGKFEAKHYSSYNEYLFTQEEPVLTVQVKKEVQGTDEQILNDPSFRRFQNGYIMYSYDNNVIKKVDKTEFADDKVTENNISIKSLFSEKTISEPISITSETAELKVREEKIKQENKQNSLLNSIFNDKEVTPFTDEEKKSNEKRVNDKLAEIAANKKNQNPKLYRINNGKIGKINIEEAKQNLAKILNVSVEVVNGKLIDSIADGVLTSDGRILLSDLAEKGTEYHEAFHRVSQFLLTENERNNLYDEYRNRNNFKGTDLEVEEKLAEDFRTFMLNQDAKIPTKQKSIFRKILDALKSIFGLSNISIKNNENADLINELFNSIKRGDFKDAQPLVEYMDYRNLYSNISLKNRIIHSLFVEVISKDVKNLFTIQNNSKLNSIYDEVFKELEKQNATLSEEQKKELINNHRKYLTQLGISSKEVDLDEDETESNINDENEVEVFNQKDSENYKESYMTSTLANVYKPIKLLVSGLSEEREGLKIALDYNSIISKVANTVANSISYEDMISKLKNSSTIQLRQLGAKLEKISDSDSFYELKLKQSFYEQFSKTKNTFIKGIYNKDGSIGLTDANTSKLQDRIRNVWVNQLQDSITNNVVRVDKGRLIISNKLSEYEVNTPQKAINFLRAIGIEIKNLTPSILSADKDILENTYQLIHYIQKSKDITDLLDKKKSDLNSRIQVLLDLASSLEEDEIELQVSLATGETAYSLSNMSFFTRTINSLKQGIIPEHLQDPYAKDSKILKLIKEGNTIDTQIISGLTESYGEGEDTSSLGKADLIAYELVNNLSGIYSLLPTGDKKTLRGFRLFDNKGKPIHYINIGKDVTTNEILRNLVDELYSYYQIEKSLQSRKEDVLPNGERKLGKPIIFDGIVTKGSLNPRNDIRDFVENILNENAKIFNDLKLFDVNNTVVPKNILKSIIGDDIIRTQEDVNKLVAAFTANNIINNIEQTKVFFGHPVFYKNFIDLFKRYAGTVAETTPVLTDERVINWANKYLPRKDGKVRDGNVEVLVLEDIKAYSEELKDFGYNEIEEADAYGIALEDFYRDIHFFSNRWTEEKEEAWQKESNGEEGDIELPAASKLVAFGSQEAINENGETLFRPFYLKYATFRMSNALFEAIKDQNGKYPKLKELLNKVEELRKEGKYIDNIVFRSGNKVGTLVDSKGKTQELYNDKGEINNINSSFVTTISMNDIGIQVENEAKDSKTISAGTQERSISLANLYEDGQPINKTIEVNGKSIKVQDAVEEYFNVQNELTEAIKDKVLRDLDLKLTDKGWVFENGAKKLRRYFIDKMLNRNQPNNYIEGLIEQLDKVANNEPVYLDTLVNKDKLQNILASIIKKNIVSQKRSGKSAVQFPSTGFELEARKRTDDGKFISDSLKFYTNGLGKRTMQVYLPFYFKGKLKGNTIEQYDENLKQMYGFRIPTEQLNSIDTIEVVGFLPKSYGKVVIVPTGLTTKVGSDFDFDKLNIYFPNFAYSLDKKDLNEFKGSKQYSELSDEDKTSLEQLSDEDFINVLEDLNNYSLTSNKGEKGNLQDSEDFLSYPTELQQVILNLKSKLIEFNKDKVFKPKYIEYNESNLNKPSLKRKALENRILELSIGLTSANFRFNEHIEPNSIDDIKDNIVKTIRENKMKVNPDLLSDDYTDFKYSDLLRFKIITDLKNKFWYGKDLVGIFALHKKAVALSQIAGLGINNYFTDADGTKNPFKLNFKGLKPKDNVYSLSRVKDINGKNTISNTTGQLLSLSVDIAKNPDILPVLNLNEFTADISSIMIRLGIPKDTVFYFLSQPIIKEYCELKQKNKNITNKEDLKESNIQEILNSKYPSGNNQVEFDNKNLLEFNNKYQNQILQEFILLKQISQNISDFQQGVSFDTITFKNQAELDYKISKYNDAIRNPLIVNKEKYIDTFLKGFKDSVIESRNYWNNLFYLNQLNDDIKDKLKTFKEKFYNSYEKRDKINIALSTIENDFLSYLISNSVVNNTTLLDNFDALLKGENSVARRFQKFKEQHPNLIALNNLIVLEDRNGDNINNIKLFNKRVNTYQVDEIANGIKDISKIDGKLAVDIFKLLMLQSGFNPSVMSYLSVMPNSNDNGLPSFNAFVEIYLGMTSPESINFTEFMDLFYRNNYQNNVIVPAYYGKRFTNDKGFTVKEGSWANNHDYIKIRNRTDGTYKLYKNIGANTFVNVETRGNGIYYKDYRSINYRPQQVKQDNKPKQEDKDQKELTEFAQKLVENYNKLSKTRKLELQRGLAAYKETVSNEKEFIDYITKTVNEGYNKYNLTVKEIKDSLTTDLNKHCKLG